MELRGWLQNRMESTRNRLPLGAPRIRVFQQVIGAEVFEQFLQNKFLGSKRFSLEGAESLIPLLERLVERAARSNVGEIVIGMAHRGRLNVLANVLKNRPPRSSPSSRTSSTRRPTPATAPATSSTTSASRSTACSARGATSTTSTCR